MSKPPWTDKYLLTSFTTTNIPNTDQHRIHIKTTPAKTQADTLADITARMGLIDAPTDLTIVCRDGRRFEIHKSVVCPQSQVLAKMCEIGMEEKRTGVIKHKEFDSATVELMLQHAYAGEYAVTKRPVPLWLLERDSELGDMEYEAMEAGKEEAVSKSGDGIGNETGLSQDEETNRSDIASDAAVITSADADDDVALPVSSPTNAPSPSTQNMAPAQNGEIACQKQQPGSSSSTHVFNATIPPGNQWLGAVDQLVTHARVYGLADYYEMEELREYSCDRFSEIVNQRVDLRPGNMLRTFIDVVREIGARTTSSNPCGLRSCFLKLVMEHATDLCTNPGFIKDLGDSGHSELAAEMLQEVSECMVRDRYYHIDRRRNLMTLHARLTEREEFWEVSAPGWKNGHR
jgi:hypothetical protein